MKTGYYWFKKDIATSLKKHVAECLQQWHIGFYNDEYPNQLFYGAYIFSFDEIDEIDNKQIVR